MTVSLDADYGFAVDASVDVGTTVTGDLLKCF